MSVGSYSGARGMEAPKHEGLGLIQAREAYLDGSVFEGDWAAGAVAGWAIVTLTSDPLGILD
eukprot:4963573-Pyramimonas_sp.AAC.1